MTKIVIVDDEIKMRVALSVVLEDEGYEVVEAESAEEALRYLHSGGDCDILITDNRMAGMRGLELLKEVTIHFPAIDTIMMTAFGNDNIGAQAFQNGALEFLSKPFEMNDLLTHIKSSIRKKAMLERVSSVKKVRNKLSFEGIIGDSPAILEAQKLCRLAAPRDTTVIVRGPSGSGKELLARSVHEASGRDTFIAINCGAIPENLLESELFGHEKGAFTGAHALKKGCFERVGGGTLFLDEIGDIPLSMQVKLLRVLQEKEFTRVGGATSIPFQGRVITATHRNLEEMMDAGSFRQDLYFRLNIFPIEIPALAERREDIPLLVKHFLGELRHNAGIKDSAVDRLVAYPWKGNIRELKNSMERAVILSCDGEIGDEHLYFLKDVPEVKAVNHSSSLLDSERSMIVSALEKSGGNKSKAARILGITRRVLYSKLKNHQIDFA